MALPSLAVPFIWEPNSVEYHAFFIYFMTYGSWLAVPALAGGLFYGIFQQARLQKTIFSGAENRSLLISMVLFILGLGVGAFIEDNSVMVTAHYHGTVGGMTMAYMGLFYHYLPQYAPGLRNATLARIQPLVYGSGIFMLILGLVWSGWLGVPRKMDFATHSLKTTQEMLGMIGMGVGGGVALVGVWIFLFWAWSPWFLIIKCFGKIKIKTLEGGEPPPNSSPSFFLNLKKKRGSGGFIPQGFDFDFFARRALCSMNEMKKKLNGVRISRRGVVWGTLFFVILGGVAISLLPETAHLTRPELEEIPTPDAAPPSSQVSERMAHVQRRFEEGVVMLHAKKYEYAVNNFHWVLQQAPTLVEAHVNMGYALIGLKEYLMAVDFFQSALELHAQQSNAYYGLALAWEGLNDIEQARGAMRSFIHLTNPDDPFVAKARSALWEWEAKATE
ncbi:MAG: hypothetical protein H7832_04690 [Magnetococcus sp. DMHC-6]